MNAVNIGHIIKNSDSKFLKSLPEFAIKIIARIIKQDELNQLLEKYSEYQGVDFLPKIIEELNIKIEIEGKENLPENGKCFFVANHPFGVLDGLILTSIVGEKYGTLKAIGNDVFRFVPNLKPIIVNVSVFGKNCRENLIELEKVFSSEVPITHFPYGLVSRIYNFKIQDKVWKKSFITKAFLNQRDIVPIRFYGRNSLLFYSIFLFRQAFRINANIELILLPRELFRKKGKNINVKIFEPILYQELDDGSSPQIWAEKLRSLIYDLEFNNKINKN